LINYWKLLGRELQRQQVTTKERRKCNQWTQ